MKKTIIYSILSFAFLMFSSHTINAQKIGARAGVNLSSFTGELDSVKSKLGLQLGVFTEFGLTDYADLHIGLLYSMKGAAFEGGASDQKNDYIDVPILLHYNLLLGRVCVEFGPNFGFLINSDWGEIDTGDLYKSIDYSGIIGAGVNIGPIRLDARYNFGLSDIKSDLFGQDVSIKNSAITLGISFLIL